MFSCGKFTNDGLCKGFSLPERFLIYLSGRLKNLSGRLKNLSGSLKKPFPAYLKPFW
ncbi:MAG: hypothetical protein IKI22_00180 [Neisseriaceae bacterium]|nr:hypothetical protein [Neisseriaceae bacterium]